MLGLSIRQLEVFHAVASTGSVRRAAEQLSLTQPAVSMALSELERQLGSTLFDRERGRLHLNAPGAEQLPRAREILERLQDMQRQHPDAQGALSGELRIGASNTVGNYLVGELLGPIVARHPQVALRLTVDNTRAITGMLLDHTIDVACVEGPVHHAQLDKDNAFVQKDELINLKDEPDHQELCNREQRYFLQAIREGIDLTDHLEDAVNSLRIAFACDASVKTGEVVKL